MNNLFVSALLTQISWTNHLVIMSKAKTMEERHFYISLCIKEAYSSRELERQIDSGYFERYMLSKEKILPEPIKGLKENPFLDSYVIEFLFESVRSLRSASVGSYVVPRTTRPRGAFISVRDCTLTETSLLLLITYRGESLL